MAKAHFTIRHLEKVYGKDDLEQYYRAIVKYNYKKSTGEWQAVEGL